LKENIGEWKTGGRKEQKQILTVGIQCLRNASEPKVIKEEAASDKSVNSKKGKETNLSFT